MKKLLSALMVVIFSGGLMGQNLQAPDYFKNMNPGVNADHIKPPKELKSMLKRAEVHHYYNFVSTLDNWTSNGNFFASVLFPDTNTLVRYSDGQGGLILGYVSWCSAGAVFDPRSSLYADYYGDDFQLEDNEPFTLDTIAFWYTYERYTSDDVVDTLVIQLYGSDKIYPYTWTANNEPFGTVDYDKTVGEGMNFTQEFRIPLTIADTHTFATGYWGIWDLAIPGGMDLKGPVAFTWTFKPGYPYADNDTMGGEWDNPVPYKPLNTWQFGLYRDNEAWPLETYNNGLFVPRWMRYDPWPAPHHRYFAGTGWTNWSYYPVTYFGITFDDAWVNSIEEVNNHFSVGEFYPNPAVLKSSVAVELKNNASVRVELLNSLGQLVEEVVHEQYGAGQHLIDVPVDHLKEGVYFCRITVDGTSITRQLLVR